MSILYSILRPVVTLAAHVFYKKIEIQNRHFLNQKGPLLFVCNHSNAFLDAITVQMFVTAQVYSLARGDVFKKPVLRTLLSALRIIPIYRKDEGALMFEKNQLTFEKCVKLLSKRQRIIIFPEGDCVLEKKLRKLKKGAARIALQAEAENNFELGLKIIPVGLNYSAAKNFRSTLFINVGQPIEFTTYNTQYATENVKAINKLTGQIESEMKKLLINIPTSALQNVYDQLLKFYQPAQQCVAQKSLAEQFKQNTKIAEALVATEHQSPEELHLFSEQLSSYHQVLKKLKIPSQLFTQQNAQQLSLFSGAKDLFLAGLGLPLHLIGLAFNYLPYRLAHRFADTKVKQDQFHASVNFGIGMFGWLIYYFLQLIIIYLLFQSGWLVLSIAVLIPFTGWYCLHYYSFYQKATGRWRVLSLLQNNETTAARLLLHRQELLNEIKTACKQYCATV